MRNAIVLATRFGTPKLNALVGVVPEGVTDEQAQATPVANLNSVAPLAGDAGITLLVEAINNVDIPRYWASTVAEAVSLVETVNHPSVRLQLDQYHAAMAGEDAIACLRKYFPLVAHIQIADVRAGTNQAPGRSPSARFSTKWIA